MPSYHIWIRKEDEAKWQAIENKPEWLHEHLSGRLVKAYEDMTPNEQEATDIKKLQIFGILRGLSQP